MSPPPGLWLGLPVPACSFVFAKSLLGPLLSGTQGQGEGVHFFFSCCVDGTGEALLFVRSRRIGWRPFLLFSAGLFLAEAKRKDVISTTRTRAEGRRRPDDATTRREA